MSKSSHLANNTSIPCFCVKEKDGILRNYIRQYEYKLYRSSYKECFGVFPELDQINNPDVAIMLDETIWPEYRPCYVRDVFKNFKKICFDIMPPGVEHSIFDDFRIELHSKLWKELVLRFSTTISPIKYIYSLACGETCLPDIDSLGVDEYIVNGLGYLFDRKNKVYYEGTWNHDMLTFGVVVMLNSNMMLFGKFNDDGTLNTGIIRTDNSLSCGRFGDEGLKCQEGVFWDMERNIMFLGPFNDNLVDGEAIVWDLGIGRIVKKKYIKGDNVNSLKYYLYRHRMRFEAWKKTARNIRNK